MIKVLLADPDPAVCAAFQILLSQKLRASVDDTAVDWDELLVKTRSIQPDLLLLDWRLASAANPGALQSLLDSCEDMLVVGMSIQNEDRSRVLAAGAHAFLYKGDSPERVIQALETLIRNRS